MPRTVQGRFTTARGNFTFKPIPLTSRMRQIAPIDRIHLFLDSSVSAKELGRRFGMSECGIRKWRGQFRTLLKEKPTVAGKLSNPVFCKDIEKRFYDYGGNHVRLFLETTASATKGFLIALKIAGYIPKTRRQHIAEEAIRMRRNGFENASVHTLAKALEEKFRISNIYSREILEEIQEVKINAYNRSK